MEADFTRLVRLSSDNGAYSANIGVFGGFPDISIFENDKKGPPIIKMLFSFASMYQLEHLLLKAIDNLEMKPVELGWWPYNKDIKVHEFKSSLSVGRDNDKCIYFEFTGVNHKDPVRMPLVIDRNMRINSQELPKQFQTEIGANTIINVMKQVLSTGVAMTRRPKGDFNDNAHSVSSRPNDDVPF